jgi:predicted RNA-binding Zn-ribbon protein involved in translation (DUF1610 family)
MKHSKRQKMKLNPPRVPVIKINFWYGNKPMDIDGDGVPDHKDCQWWNHFKQDDYEQQLMDAWEAIEKSRETKKEERVICPDCGKKIVPIIKNGKKICPNCGIHRIYEYEYE